MNNSLTPHQGSELSLTLQNSIENMESENNTSVASLSQHQFETGLLKALKESRLSKTRIHECATPSEAIVYLILHHTGVQWKAIVKNISVEAVFARPSLIALVNGELLEENQVILILLRIIESISGVLGSKTTQSAEELAWIIYEKYPNWTLEDFLIFAQKSKDGELANDYEKASTKRGLTGEHLLSWLRAYGILREDSRNYLAYKIRSNQI